MVALRFEPRTFLGTLRLLKKVLEWCLTTVLLHHLYSIKAKDTPYYLECLGGRETPSHIIKFCPFYKENRLILKEKINNILKRPSLTPLDLREILKNKATLPILLY